MEMPVYLFTGFLESGKTTFIQEAMEGSDFNSGERTLFLLCEEGEEEYHPSKFFGTNVFFETIEDEEQLTPQFLESLQKKHKPERIVVEYNGMWMLDSLYQNMPESWITYQEMLFADSRTFLTYNQNMRNLVVDKLKSAEMVILNRCEKGFDKMPYHKIIRAINRKSQILYEYDKDDVELDNIQDPLPFDINAPVIEIKDEDYAEWYRDINEETDKYDGKTITVKGRSVIGGELPENFFIFGRHVMTCCVEDIQFAGLVCNCPGYKGIDLKEGENPDMMVLTDKEIAHGGWVTVTAKIKVEENVIYGEVGPVLYVTDLKHTQMPSPEVATF